MPGGRGHRYSLGPGGAMVLRESLSWQGARLKALVGGVSGEFPRVRWTAVGGRGS